jgi:hypothetical protein
VATPEIEQYSIIYDYGLAPYPNLSFTMRGEKTIGNNPTVYKYNQTHSSGGGSSITLSNIEADTYTLSIATVGQRLAESCEPQPQALSPGTSQTTRLYVLPQSTHTLLIDVRGGGSLISGASIELTATGYEKTLTTGECGQSYFDALAADTYLASVTAAGYQPYSTNVTVLNETRLSIVLAPL